MASLAIISCEMVSNLRGMPVEGVGNSHTVPKVQELARRLLNSVGKLSVQCVSVVYQSGPVL